MSEELKQLVLDKRKEGKLVHTTVEGFVSVDVSEFIKQPADGILYDLNRLEEVVLTFIDDPKWLNDFAVALTIRALKTEIETLKEALHQEEHIIIFTDDGWSVQHLVECRPDMTKCEIHKRAQIELNAGDTGLRGKFKVSIVDGVLDFERIRE